MTGGAQGQTGMWIIGSQSASKAPQVLMESLVFSSTFSFSQPILFFFFFYLLFGAPGAQRYSRGGCRPRDPGLSARSPSYWTEPGVEPNQGHGRRARHRLIPQAQCPDSQRMSNPKGTATSSSQGCTRSLDGVGEAWPLLVTITPPAAPRCRGVCMPKPHPHFLGRGAWQ